MVAPSQPTDEPPWRRSDGYDYTGTLPRRAWAWEFLRRNASYQRAWSDARMTVAVESPTPKLTLATATTALDDLAPWVCFFADPPQQDATTAAVFWRPEACPHVLPVIAATPAARHRAFSLSQTQHPMVLLRIPDGRQHVLIREGCRSLQLVLEGEKLFEPVRLLTDALVEPRRLRARLDGIECLNTISAGRSFPNRLFPRDPMARRLRQVLQALDGWLAGASYRDIAIALFGEARVAADWGDPRKYLFDQVRRAVRRGRILMDGGYRRLLL